MHPILEKIEKAADALVVPALLLIAVILTLELLFTQTAHHYHSWIQIADYAIIGIFTFDLSFKAYRASTWEGFLKEHWLEIIAIMPLFLVFRVFTFLRVFSGAELGQEAAHLAEGARSGRLSAIVQPAEASRSTRFAKFVRPISRSPRLAKAAEFFKHPEEE
jgi:hypothetical protein